MAAEGIIDVHHHIMPPDYVRIMGAEAIGSPSTSRRLPQWSKESATEVLDRHGISKAYTSISAPGVLLRDAQETARLARLCNDYATRLAGDTKGRFGTFAILPLPDIPSSIQEVDHAFDTLESDGVVLMTNYGGKYLGDPVFRPLFEHLNNREAVVFVHPTVCGCGPCHPDASDSLLEFPFDTTRTIVSLLFSRVFERCPNIRFIFSHGGGALPFLSGRIAGLGARNPALEGLDVMRALRTLYYDTALSASRPVFAALRELVPIGQIVFGSDYPFAPDAQVGASLRGLSEVGLDNEEMRLVKSGNAMTLLPANRRKR